MAITEWRGISGLCRGGGGWTLGALRVWERRVRRAGKAGNCLGDYGRAGGGPPAALCGSLDDALAAVAWATEDEGYGPLPARDQVRSANQAPSNQPVGGARTRPTTTRSVARVRASLSFELYGLPLRRGVDPSWLLTLRLARRGFLFRFLPGNGGNFAACYRV